MPKLHLLLPPLLAAQILSAPTANAAPDDVCVRQANAVPGAAVKHPQWWAPGLSANQKEVRWTGATRRSSGDGATPELASSRVIWDQPSHTAFFEVTVHNDPSIDQTQDIAMFAFANATGDQPETFVMFQPLLGCASAANCDGAGSEIPAAGVHYSQATAGATSISWSPLSGSNTSPDFTVSHPWVQIEEVVSGGSTTYDWTLRFALELPTSGSNIRPNLRTYGNAVMYVPGPTSGSAIEFPLMCNNDSSTSEQCMAFSGSSSAELPGALPISTMATTWPVMRSSDPGSCEGIELLRPLIGSDHGMSSGNVPGTSTPYQLPGSGIPRDSGAHFRAGFLNDTGDTIGSGTVTAQFRVANWGLQWANWDQATWDEVGTAVLAGDVSPGAYAGGFGEGVLESDLWVPATSGLALENDHQCIHVRLSSSNPGVKFKVDSVYRNMDIINASVARRPADIDLGDRPLPKGQKAHKVFLMVRSKHMPDPGTCSRTKKKLYGCAKGGPLVMARTALNKRQKSAIQKAVNEGRLKMSKAQLDDVVKQKSRSGKKQDELPYYAVYGMVDTGQRINLPGAPQTPVLTNFSSYGYNVQHEGLPVEGWETYIHGADRVNDNLYTMEIPPKKVASIANTVRVLSKETKTCKVKPKSNWAVYGMKKTTALETEVRSRVGKGKPSAVRDVRVTDEQLGCDPPPLRLPCRLEDCRVHSPIDYIEGSRYVGDWSAVEGRVQTVKPPTGSKRPGRMGRGTTPTPKPTRMGRGTKSTTTRPAPRPKKK